MQNLWQMWWNSNSEEVNEPIVYISVTTIKKAIISEKIGGDRSWMDWIRSQLRAIFLFIDRPNLLQIVLAFD